MAGAHLRAAIERLAVIDRASCSPGEHEAAEWIAAELRRLGADAQVEHHAVHGTYWVPLSITSALGIAATVAGRRGRRGVGFLLGMLGTAGVIDELGAGRRVLRGLLPKQQTANVVAWAGDPDAELTLIVASHHDAAHTGIFFNPKIAEFLARRLGEDKFVERRLEEGSGRSTEVPAPMLPVAAAPAAAGLSALLGARRTGTVSALVCGGIIASLAHIAASPTVPGANDNLTGVATVLGLARALRQPPIRGLRVILVSTGSEESLMEGMRAFARRHFPALSRQSTFVLCVDSVGSPHLVLAEAEGMLQVRDYDDDFEALIAGCAASEGIRLIRGFRMRLGTDGYVALRHGFPAALLMSMNDLGLASNYHWPTDTPDRVDYSTVEEAVRLCEAVARRLARPEPLRRQGAAGRRSPRPTPAGP
jgi:hypothetical protein